MRPDAPSRLGLMADFILRPMEPSDGPAIDLLMRTEAQTTSMSMTTHYRHDVYQALLAQHPTLYGVVAEAPGHTGIVGMATAFTDEVSIGGRVMPSAHLENLKVHHDVRRQGLGSRLAAWRIDEAQRRFGGEGVITTGVEITQRRIARDRSTLVDPDARSRPRGRRSRPAAGADDARDHGPADGRRRSRGHRGRHEWLLRGIRPVSTPDRDRIGRLARTDRPRDRAPPVPGGGAGRRDHRRRCPGQRAVQVTDRPSRADPASAGLRFATSLPWSRAMVSSARSN